jgi:Zn-finger nucleic acid-binding protein
VNPTIQFDCPRCGTGLAMTERQGIEVDYCPQCRGVWLDRGELDKIIERSETALAPSSQAAPDWAAQGTSRGSPQPAQPPRYQQPWGDDRHGHDRKRRKSWLEEILG